MGKLVKCKNCEEEKTHYSHGLCKACYKKQYKRPPRKCKECGEIKPIAGNDLCAACYKSPPRECAGCGEIKPIKGNGLCFTCYKSPPRECKGCGEIKPITGNDLCKACYERWKLHKLTYKEYMAMLEKQNNKCAICEKPFTDENKPNVDHCYTTKQNRGLLCRDCNLGLGHFKDNLNSLQKAIDYVKSHRSII